MVFRVSPLLHHPTSQAWCLAPGRGARCMLGLAPQLHHPCAQVLSIADTVARARCVLGLAPQLHHPAAVLRCPAPPETKPAKSARQQAGCRRRQHRRTVSLDTSTYRENTKQTVTYKLFSTVTPQSGPGSELQTCMLGTSSPLSSSSFTALGLLGRR